MSYRILLFLYRKPGFSPTVFKAYCETKHVPLLQSIAGVQFPKVHVRRYVHRASYASSSTDSYPASVLVGTQSDFEYEAIAKAIFDNEAGFQAFMGMMSQPDAAARIAEDEEKLLDRSKMKAVVLGDCNTTSGPGPT